MDNKDMARKFAAILHYFNNRDWLTGTWYTKNVYHAMEIIVAKKINVEKILFDVEGTLYFEDPLPLFYDKCRYYADTEDFYILRYWFSTYFGLKLSANEAKEVIKQSITLKFIKSISKDKLESLKVMDELTKPRTMEEYYQKLSSK